MPACGFAAQMHPGQTHHDTSAQVALCSRRYYDAKAEQAAQDVEDDGARQAELAYERKLESAGDDEARLQDEMEARRGVVPFDVALRSAERAREDGPPRQRVDWAAIRRIPVGKYDKGRYALRGDDGVVKFYLVSRSDSGWTSVEVLAGPQRHEIPQPAQTPILARIAADPLVAAELYAEEKEECSQCGTGLTHPDSLARKMGPDCAKEFRRKAGAA
jgi:hypothetical protein